MDYYQSIGLTTLFLFEEKALKRAIILLQGFLIDYPIVALNLTFLNLKSIPFSWMVFLKS